MENPPRVTPVPRASRNAAASASSSKPRAFAARQLQGQTPKPLEGFSSELRSPLNRPKGVEKALGSRREGTVRQSECELVLIVLVDIYIYIYYYFLSLVVAPFVF